MYDPDLLLDEFDDLLNDPDLLDELEDLLYVPDRFDEPEDLFDELL